MVYSQLKRVETKVKIDVPPEKFYDVFCNTTHHISKIFPEKVHSIQIHKGEWGNEGSIISWNFALEGKTYVAKEVIEGVDRKNNKMTFKVIDGDLLEHYKSFKFILQVIPKEEGGIAHLVLEYEKEDDHIPDPIPLLQLTAEVMQKVGAHLLKDQN